MKIDQEIQKIIDEYIQKIENKEEKLISFKQKVEDIILRSEDKYQALIRNLDNKFDNNTLSEEEYLSEFKKEKKSILDKTKNSLNLLVQSLE